MTPFELAEPASLREAIALLDPDDSTVRAIAGGTALMLMMKAGVFRPTRLVSLRKLGSLGQPVLRSKAKELERQFAERMRAAFAPAAGGESR